MAGTGRKLAIVHGAQLPAHGLLGNRQAELVKEPLAKISDPPSDHAMNGGDRPALDDYRQRPPMRVIEKRGLPRRLAVDQALGPPGVELDDPITDDLQGHASQRGRLRPRRAIINRRKSQKSPRLWSIFRPLGSGPYRDTIEISPKRNRHGENPRSPP